MMARKTKIVYNSLLWPLFEKYVTDPLFKFIPWGLPANVITLIGNFCLLLGTLTAYFTHRGTLTWWPLIPVLVYIYLGCDCLDGKQARRTNTSSSLGGFLDHFFDILAMGHMLTMLIFAFDINDPFTVGVMIAVGYLSIFGSYYEQYYTRTMVFESISAFEMMTFSNVLCCLGFFGRGMIRGFLKIEIFFHISILDLAIGFAILVGIISMIKNIHRTGRTGKKRCFLYFPLMAVVVFFSAKFFGVLGTVFIVTLYCGTYVERLMIAYEEEKKEPTLDFMFPLLLGAAFGLNIPGEIVFMAGMAYQIISLVVVFLYGFIPLRDGWVWINPPNRINPPK
jgi:ethanolaminephosphotransferase